MSQGRHATPVKLAKKEREELLSLIERKTATQRDVMRARIALWAHEGHANTVIARELRISVQTVCTWRKRIAQQGARGLREGERSGRRPRITQETRLQLIALACEAHEPEGRVTPTLDEIVARAIERGIVEQISRSHVQRILQAGDVRPHRVKQWLHSPDPAFREKVNVICRFYRKVPRNAVVLSIDEKTGIQAIERKHPGRAPAPGRLRRREFEYIRHGTQALIAALDVHTGQVLADCRERRTQGDLVAFMERVAVAYPSKQVHVIWDNLNTHRAQAVWQAFNARHDERFHFHFTPLHASWVNQIELWFAHYTRRVLRHASHTSTAHLRERTEQFVRAHNQTARPFKWTFRGYPLQTGAS
ncbi:IS630 family transposase [Paraburkholderia tuberum]|uniref:Homeodomain-like domain-containing protein n=1 Tax=Paraburkholderia tuberum TaxID=157910 RepID=A0A1H1KIX1_9BURK|nr:IS630 family transposase [Paraburkholderia tuberum]SDR62278.1 Homeodomain-like domain-containing protein [Paraburkholderia tuberum]